jgi:hypothetical protein
LTDEQSLPFDQFQCVELAFVYAIPTCGAFVRVFHDDAHSRFVFYQYMAGTSPDATSASGATAFDHANDPLPALLTAAQIVGNP